MPGAFAVHPLFAQEMFQRVYGVRSSSNNNLWLRKKLIEAVNTRPRGGSGSGSDAPRPTYQPRHVERGEPAGYGGAAAAGSGEDAGRRRRKKSAPTRASDGVQVGPGRGGRAGLALAARVASRAWLHGCRCCLVL